MSELFENTLRDPEQDCKDMIALLTQRGWVVVNGVVRSISAGMGLYNQVEPGTVSVFSPTEKAERLLPKYPGMANNINIQMPYVMLARETFRYGFLNSMQIAGGTIAGINGFKLAEKS